MPESNYGPAVLAPKNYFLLKDYNFSDLHVLFVGHLSDRILDPRPFETPWSKTTQMRTADVETMQRPWVGYLVAKHLELGTARFLQSHRCLHYLRCGALPPRHVRDAESAAMQRANETRP